MIRHAALLGAALLCAGPVRAAAAPAAAAATRGQVEQAERARAAQLHAEQAAAARAATATAQARRLADARVAAAARLRETETAVGEAAARVADLAGEERAAQLRLADREAAFVPLLPLLERLSLYPEETLIGMDLPPEQALRGVAVLGGISRGLDAEAAELRAEQAEVRALQARIAAELPSLRAAQSVQAREAAALDAQIRDTQAQRASAEDAAAQAAQRAAAEAARADGLRAAIARLEADRAAAEAQARQATDLATRQRREADAAAARRRQQALARPAGPGLTQGGRGGMASPVVGTLVHAFGEASDAGPTSGISVQAPPAARVVAPCGGRVVFAGPFRSFGQLIIVDCGGGFHVVLAGLDRIDATVGRPVQQGEPVGVMPAWDPRAGGARPSLYVELRKNGEAIDPTPFLRAKA